MKIKKGDTVLVISGKDRGKAAKVLRSLVKESRILVEGVNLKKKHMRRKREGEKGQMAQVPAPIPVSNVKFVCPSCKKAVRLGYRVSEKEKFRICKQCKAQV
jgi:large subunit ribosomal protein L24